jgi:hypothetical protein
MDGWLKFEIQFEWNVRLNLKFDYVRVKFDWDRLKFDYVRLKLG